MNWKMLVAGLFTGIIGYLFNHSLGIYAIAGAIFLAGLFTKLDNEVSLKNKISSFLLWASFIIMTVLIVFGNTGIAG